MNNHLTPPRLSVITVVLNGEQHLEKTIRSVIQFPEIEYILIDGGSTDGTLDIIHKYTNTISFWSSEPDKGIFDAMNRGLAYASGQTINMLNCGDTFNPEYLKLLLNESDLQDCVIYSDYYRVYDELHLKRKYSSDMNYHKGMSICHQTMFIGKNVYKQIGNYSLTYRFAADYDFMIRMINGNVFFKKIPLIGVNFLADGATARHLQTSIREASTIHAHYFGNFSLSHIYFLSINYKNLLFHLVKKYIPLSIMLRLRQLQKSTIHE